MSVPLTRKRNSFLKSVLFHRGPGATIVILILVLAAGWRNYGEIQSTAGTVGTLISTYKHRLDEQKQNEAQILEKTHAHMTQLDGMKNQIALLRAELKKLGTSLQAAMKAKAVCRIDDSYRPGLLQPARQIP